MYQKSQSCMVPEIQSETGRFFCHFRSFFALLTLMIPKIKILQPPDKLQNQNFKIEKNTQRYYNLTHLYQKWQSYDVWFLRYWAWQTEFFCHFGPFFALLPPNKILKKWKNFLEISSFYTSVTKIMIICYAVP